MKSAPLGAFSPVYRAEAATIFYHLTGMDLGMGPHVEFRQVVLRVRFSDGSPMKTVQIRCIGLPVLEAETPWVFGRVVMDSANGSIQFLAPANRTLQLEVKDWYGPGS